MRLEVKVVAGASRDRIAGWLGECLRVTVSAPPERGRANRAAAGLLREVLGVDVRLLEGERSPRKIFDVPGLDAAAVRERVATRR
ncbi:MAG TPA: DUF167 family protein [Candidatus Binatia bacterium]|nr:DUF167 family protein [Candidatus Binatia bacterium]